MRILIIENASMSYNKGKYYTYIANGKFIQELIACKHKVSYFNFAIEKESSISTFDLEQAGVRVYNLKYYKSKAITYLNAYLRMIPVFLKQDFIYFYYPSSLKYGAIYCWFFKKRFGLYVRGMKGIKNRFSNWIYQKSKITLTVSDYFTDLIKNKSNHEYIQTIRPMIPYKFKDILKHRQYREKKAYQILFLGRLDEEKGLKELLNAVKILSSNKNNFFVKLVGDGSFSSYLQEYIRENNLDSYISLEGFVSDPERKEKYYKDADIYILPTYHEGFPRTLYEAMIYRTPIITTFVGGISTLMQENINCLRIEKKSVESIVRKLEYAFSNYDKMIALADNGANTVAKILDPRRLTHARQLNQILIQYDKKVLE